MNEDRNCLSWWFPRIEAAGLPVPRTTILRAEGDLTVLLDGHTPDGWFDFCDRVEAACLEHGLPCFLRTGHGSGKHEWSRTCFVEDADLVAAHIGTLVEWSHLVDIMGLPHEVWAVRDLIPTAPLFTCERYAGFPVVREFRAFVRDGDLEHLQPYWPAEAVESGRPEDPQWAEKLTAASDLGHDRGLISDLAVRAGEAVGGGYWSVDFLQARNGGWWLTDMAGGDRSFRYESEAVAA